MANGLRIGLLGGSFNPAHEGHVHASDLALKRLNLDLDDEKIPPDRLQIFLSNRAEVEKACASAHEQMLALVAGQAQRVA